MDDHYLAWKISLEKYNIKLDRRTYFLLEGMGLNQIAKNVNMDLDTLINICESNALDFSLIEEQVKIE